MKLTAKQQLFCQEIALNNKSQVDAYRTAYNTSKMKDKTVNEKASIEANKGNVRARIDELRATVERKLIDEIVYTKQDSFKKFQELQELALVPRGDNGNLDLNNALKAEKHKGELMGLYSQEVDIDLGQRGISVKIITNG